MKRAITILAIVCLLCVGLAGAQDYVCGDANYDSVANIDDGAYLFDYLVTGGPAPVLPDPAWANWDGHDGLTINDVFACFWLSEGNDPTCPVEGPLAPELGSSFKYFDTIPPMAAYHTINIAHFFGIKAFILPLHILVDGIPQAIDSIVVLPQYPVSNILVKGSVIYPDPSICVIGACLNTRIFSDGYCAKIYITLTPTPIERTVSLEWADATPLQATEPADIISPMYVYRWSGSDRVYEPELLAQCCIVAGDANNDGVCNVGDCVFIIAYAFRSGADPVCFNTADANRDCGVNVGDAVYIFGYCWRGGSAPACSDCAD